MVMEAEIGVICFEGGRITVLAQSIKQKKKRCKKLPQTRGHRQLLEAEEGQDCPLGLPQGVWPPMASWETPGTSGMKDNTLGPGLEMVPHDTHTALGVNSTMECRKGPRDSVVFLSLRP